MKTFILFSLFFILLFPVVCAEEKLNLPPGLQKIIDYNQNQAVFFSDHLTFFVAFLGGMLSFFLPCTLAILPAYFAYTFKTERQLTKKTLLFFLGFSLVFVVLGIIAGLIKTTLDELRVNYELLTVIVGIFIVFFGIMMIFGKGIPLLTIRKRPDPSNLGIFVWGILFSLGWFACAGPILSGILLMATLLGNMFKSGLLLFFYSLGIFVPFFLVSVLYDKYDLGKKSWMKGTEIHFSAFGKEFFIHSTNLISGILLIFIGLIFIIFRGTSIVNQTITYTTTSIYDAERGLASMPSANIIGIVIFLLFVGIVGWILFRKQQ